MTEMQLYLIRHGDYDEGQAGGQGPRVDLGLNDAGRRQASLLAERLAARGLRPSRLLCSTERRAMETAALLAPALGVAVTPERDLEEWRSDLGRLDGEVFMAQWQALDERERAYHRFVPEGETPLEFSTRVRSTLHRVVTAAEGGSVVLLTHGGFIQVAFQYFFAYGDAAFRRAFPAAGHTGITQWRRDEAGRWWLERFNDRSHLGDDL